MIKNYIVEYFYIQPQWIIGGNAPQYLEAWVGGSGEKWERIFATTSFL